MLIRLLSKTIVLAGLLVATSAAAVSLSHSGTGQVLIYPYYTVNAGQQSQLSLVNHSDAAKAVKLVVREAVYGHAVFALDVYLAPHDTWTGTLFELDDKPALISDDAGCTVPDLHADALPALPDGRHYLRPNVGGLTGGEDVREEGYAVAIEMGTLEGDSAAALDPDPDRDPYDYARPPAHCDHLVAAWQQGGYWQKDPATDIGAPNGGLSGSVQLIDVPNGKLFKVKAPALEDFRVAAMHTAPDSTLPDLGSALSDAASGVASAEVQVGDQALRSDYPADRAVDAVTAVLMSESLGSQFDFRRSIDAYTDFVFTMPTKRFHVSDSGPIIPPFGRDQYLQRSPRGTLCPIVGQRAWNHDGGAVRIYPILFLGPSFEELTVKPCYATSVLALARDDRTLLHSQLAPTKYVGDALAPVKPLTDSQAQLGRVVLDMNYYPPACYSGDGCDDDDYASYVQAHINVMRPDLQGRQYFGLPVVGFRATGFINDHAGGLGIVGNYTTAVPFDRSPKVCAQDGVVGACAD